MVGSIPSSSNWTSITPTDQSEALVYSLYGQSGWGYASTTSLISACICPYKWSEAFSQLCQWPSKSDDALCQHLIYLLPDDLPLCQWHPVGSLFNGYCIPCIN